MYKLLWFLGILSVSLVLLLALPVRIESKAPVVVIEEVKVKPTIKEYAKLEVEKAFGEGQWVHFDKVIRAESKWVHTAKNPRSSAYGLCQTMLSVHKPPKAFMNDPYMQVDWCIEYVKKRYRTPQLASSFWDRNKWF
jgi:hypothetical protein